MRFAKQPDEFETFGRAESKFGLLGCRDQSVSETVANIGCNSKVKP